MASFPKKEECEIEKIWMESYQLWVTVILGWNQFEFLRFGIPRWPIFASYYKEHKHENDNISITAEWRRTK